MINRRTAEFFDFVLETPLLVCETLLLVWMGFFALITSPIWIVPWLIRKYTERDIE